MAGKGKIKIDKFDGQDFGFWKMKIKDYLYQTKLHEPLFGEKTEKTSDIPEVIGSKSLPKGLIQHV